MLCVPGQSLIVEDLQSEHHMLCAPLRTLLVAVQLHLEAISPQSGIRGMGRTLAIGL